MSEERVVAEKKNEEQIRKRQEELEKQQTEFQQRREDNEKQLQAKEAELVKVEEVHQSALRKKNVALDQKEKKRLDAAGASNTFAADVLARNDVLQKDLSYYKATLDGILGNGVIPCQACTFEQTFGQAKCEICGADLLGAGCHLTRPPGH